ncbi:unnamed protein product [Calicophoron daubneyi]|uniref:C2H2-type domain-containing protein n=1 Tax=Calicophoron daubneyi TaxID=300641 RepID=A0AAV2TAE2_CALDB
MIGSSHQYESTLNDISKLPVAGDEFVSAWTIPQSSVALEGTSTGPVSGYFITTEDGTTFSSIDPDNVKEALAHQLPVYYVDDPVTLISTDESGKPVVAPTDIPSYLIEQTSGGLVYVESVGAQCVPVKQPLEKEAQFTVTGIAPQLLVPSSQQFSIFTSGLVPVTVSPRTVKKSSNSPSAEQKVPKRRVCPLCGLEFPTLRAYRGHILMHKEDKPHRCTRCPATFNFADNLTVHFAKNHEVKSVQSPYKCPICKITASRVAAYKSHLSTHETEDTIECPNCHKPFESEAFLKCHEPECKSKTNTEIRYHCRICREILSTVGEIQQHYRVNHPNNLKPKIRRVTTQITEKSKIVPESSSKQSPPKTELPFTEHQSERRSKTCGQQIILDIVKDSAHKRKPVDPRYNAFIRQVLPINFTKPDANVMADEKKAKGRRKKRKVLSCPVCDKKFTKPCLLNRHTLTHSGIKPFECIICHTQFTQKSSVKTHMAQHYPASHPACPVCGTNFFDPSLLLEHIEKEHDLRSFGLPGLDPSFTLWPATKPQISQQFPPEHRLQEPRNQVELKMCTIGTEDDSLNPNDSQTLLVSSSDPPRPGCIDPPAAQIQSSNNPDFSLSPNKNDLCLQSFTCSVCHKCFSQNRVLKVHMLCHSSKPLPYSCPMCPRRFANYSHQRYHIITHKLREKRQMAKMQRNNQRKIWRAPGPPLKWDYAKQCFINPSRPLGPYRCEYCCKSFRYTNHLRFHLRQKHNPNAAPNVCHHCSERFVSAVNLRKHIAIKHDGTLQRSPSTCPICGTKFANNSSMKRHLAVHSSDKLYCCFICCKRFKFQTSCRRHMQTHANDNDILVEVQEGPEVATVVDFQPFISASTSNEEPQVLPMSHTGLNDMPRLSESDCILQSNEADPVLVGESTHMPEAQQNPLLSVGSERSDHPIHEVDVDSDPVPDCLHVDACVILKPSPTPPKSPLPSAEADQSNTLTSSKILATELYGCGRCDVCYDNAADLQAHNLEVHSMEVKRFQCKTCCFSFKSETELVFHGLSHTGSTIPDLLCPVCPMATFSNRSGLSRHISACHSSMEDVPFRCVRCGMKFRLIRSLQAHIRNTCVYSTKTPKKKNRPRPQEKSNSKEGVAVDSGPSGYVNAEPVSTTIASAVTLDPAGSHLNRCPICNRPFRLRSDLRRHICVHTKRLPFQCKKCNRQFLKHSLLLQHTNSMHAGLKTSIKPSHPAEDKFTEGCSPFKCSVCGGHFASKSALSVHEKVHVTDCPYCHERFASLVLVEKHLSQCPVHKPSSLSPDHNVLTTPRVNVGADEPTVCTSFIKYLLGSPSQSSVEIPCVTTNTVGLPQMGTPQDQPSTLDLKTVSDSLPVSSSNNPIPVSLSQNPYQSEFLSTQDSRNECPQLKNINPVIGSIHPPISVDLDQTPIEQLGRTLCDGRILNKATSTVGHQSPDSLSLGIAPTLNTVSPKCTGPNQGKSALDSGSQLTPLYKCSICPEVFDTSTLLTCHERSHSNTYPSCSVCPNSFARSLHSDGNPNGCSRCEIQPNQSLNTSGDLQIVCTDET